MEQIANDAEAIIGLDNAKEKFLSGRLEKQQGLEELEKLSFMGAIYMQCDEMFKSYYDGRKKIILSRYKLPDIPRFYLPL